MFDTRLLLPRYTTYLGIYSTLFYLYIYYDYYYLNSLLFAFNGMILIDIFYYKREYLVYNILYENPKVTRDFVTNTFEGRVILSFLISAAIPNGKYIFILELSDLGIKYILNNFSFPSISIPGVFLAAKNDKPKFYSLLNSYLIFTFAFFIIVFNILFSTFIFYFNGNYLFIFRQLFSIYSLVNFLYTKSVKNIYSINCEIFNYLVKKYNIIK